MATGEGRPRSSTSLRRELVAALERAGAVRSTPVRRAFQAVPREVFVPEIVARDGLPAIYRPDLALATALDRRGRAISSSSAPTIMGFMLEALQLSPGHRVLEVGAGTGYNAALLKYLVGDGGRVTSIDIEPSFARRARRALTEAGFTCRIVVGDGRAGWARAAPYDRIIVTAASSGLPQAWRDQLADDGLIELPLRVTSGFLPQLVVTLRREGNVLRSVAVLSGAFMGLRDAEGAPSPADHGPTVHAVRGAQGMSKVVASLSGESLSRLSATAQQRVLSLLLGKSRRLRTFPSESGLDLITFLQLSGAANLVNCSVDDRYGVAYFGPHGSSVATVTRGPGQPARIEAWGHEPVEHLFSKHLQQWERLGGPGPSDLRLTVTYGPRAPQSWRTLRSAGSVVTMDWAS
jgi:protein-L-isoaspartate(D-aspartate) O-methyltransferase